jgi:hypothetical protein
MKLNLVPTYVSKERQGRTAILGSAAIAIVGIVVAVLLSTSSRKALQSAIQANSDSKGPAATAADTAAQADTILNDPKSVQLIRNASLAEAMNKHSDVFPDFYTNDILPYVPPFYRLTSISAQAIDGSTCSVTMTGTLKTFAEYGDLVLALMRIKGASSVSRQGFSMNQYIVPNLTPNDQTGTPHRINEGPVPDDPVDRLAYYESLGTPPPGYLNEGNYGSGEIVARGAAPEESLVTVVVTVAKNLQTPEPRETLQSGGGGAAPALGGLGGPGLGGPGMPTGFGGPGAPGGVSGPAGAPAGKGGGD